MLLETRVIHIEGIPVRYAVTGRGRPLVLLHGLAGSWRWWLRNIPAFRERHSVYLIDLPGFGSMRAHRRRFSLERAPEWIRTLVRALGLEAPSIVGHSMGGAIAMSYAARWPREVNRLILVAPAVNLPHKTVLSNIVPLLAGARHFQAKFYPTLVWDAMRAGPLTLLRAATDLFAMDVSAEIKQVQCPVLLIWGRQDRLVPPDIADTLRKVIPASRLQIIDGAGHVVMFDQPAAFNDTVLRFLSGEEVGT